MSDGVKEGLRRLAKAIEISAWLWLALCLSLGALSAWGQHVPPTYDAGFQQTPNPLSPDNSPRTTSPPPERTLPASARPSIDPQIDPSKVQWEPQPKHESALDALIARDTQMGAVNESVTASGPEGSVAHRAKDYFPSYFLAIVGVMGFAILRTLAWILAGFAK